MAKTQTFHLSSPKILNVDSSWESANQAHINWFVSYAPEREAESNERVLFATLHAVTDDGRGNVQVAAMIQESTDFTDWESFEKALAESDALDTLYLFALNGLRTALSLVGGAVGPVDNSPEPEFDQLVPADDLDDEQPATSDRTTEADS